MEFVGDKSSPKALQGHKNSLSLEKHCDLGGKVSADTEEDTTVEGIYMLISEDQEEGLSEELQKIKQIAAELKETTDTVSLLYFTLLYFNGHLVCYDHPCVASINF